MSGILKATNKWISTTVASFARRVESDSSNNCAVL